MSTTGVTVKSCSKGEGAASRLATWNQGLGLVLTLTEMKQKRIDAGCSLGYHLLETTALGVEIRVSDFRRHHVHSIPCIGPM